MENQVLNIALEDTHDREVMGRSPMPERYLQARSF